MKHFRLKVSLPSGGIMVGGQADAPGRLHAAHARDERGAPMIPATALRGALRETYERILRGAYAEDPARGEPTPICSGGNGRAPDGHLEVEGDQPCTLDQNGPCQACRLFGSRRVLLDSAGDFSALRLSDARVVHPAGGSPFEAWGIRPGVAITRSHRSAEDGRLFMRQVPDRPGLQLEADLWLLDDSLEDHLRLAVDTTRHLGGSRSRGLGRIDLTLEELPHDSAGGLPSGNASSRGSTRPQVATGTAQELRLRLTLRSPAFLGTGINSRYVMDTRSEIPGATIRGMLGFALARGLPDPDHHTDFQTLVDAERGARFGFFYPASSEPSGRQLSAPLPITVETCKSEKLKHGWRDTLLEQLAISLVEDSRQAGKLHARDMKVRKTCPSCEAPLRRAEGHRCTPEKPQIQSVTRVSLNRSFQSAQEQQLFSQRLVKRGTCFEGRILRLPPGGKALIERALAEPLVVGRGHAYGWGQCEVVAVPTPQVPTMADRQKAFQKALREQLQSLGLDGTRAERQVSMTLLSPALPANEQFVADLEKDLQATCVLKLRRFDREGWYEQRASSGTNSEHRGGMSACLAVAAGGVYIFEWRTRQQAEGALKRLETLEKECVGEGRHLGFGQVCFYDPIHLERAMVPSKPVPKTGDNMPVHKIDRKALVTAAEALFNVPNTPLLKIKKSQLNHLINVCGDAVCVAEIENYLRYQAGREGTGWSVEAVRTVIAGPLAAANAARALALVESEPEEVAEMRAVQAWRLYAVYLTRAFTYRMAADKANAQGGGGARDAGHRGTPGPSHRGGEA